MDLLIIGGVHLERYCPECGGNGLKPVGKNGESVVMAQCYFCRGERKVLTPEGKRLLDFALKHTKLMDYLGEPRVVITSAVVKS